MTSALLDGLRRNLASGARLLGFRPLSPADFRVSPEHFVVLAAFNVLVTTLCAVIRTGLDGRFDFEAMPLILAQFAAVLLFSLAIARAHGRSDMLLSLATMLIAGDALFEIVGTGISVFAAAGLFPSPTVFRVLSYGYLAWAFATMVRAMLLLAPWRRPRSVYGVGLLAVLFGVFALGFMRADLWVQDDDDVLAAGEDEPSIVQEAYFHRQQTLLDEQLDALAPERPGEVDLYFVGVAPYSREDVFVKEMASVRKLFDEHFGTAGRSLVLANSPTTLADTPIATATNLRYALAEVASIMNPQEDVLFLFLSSHGDAHHELTFELPPLELEPLTPTALGRMLQDSGVKWKVIVVSACYSGGYLEPLKDQNSVIITAADDNSSSFGCENGRDFTWFGKAYFDEALRHTHSFAAAFEAARARVSERERAEDLKPSSPQMFVGSAIRERLPRIEAQLTTAR